MKNPSNYYSFLLLGYDLFAGQFSVRTLFCVDSLTIYWVSVDTYLDITLLLSMI